MEFPLRRQDQKKKKIVQEKQKQKWKGQNIWVIWRNESWRKALDFFKKSFAFSEGKQVLVMLISMFKTSGGFLVGRYLLGSIRFFSPAFLKSWSFLKSHLWRNVQMLVNLFWEKKVIHFFSILPNFNKFSNTEHRKLCLYNEDGYRLSQQNYWGGVVPLGILLHAHLYSQFSFLFLFSPIMPTLTICCYHSPSLSLSILPSLPPVLILFPT